VVSLVGVAGASVDEFARDVEVASAPSSLFDHMDQHQLRPDSVIG
jgi:hypothetical protein